MHFQRIQILLLVGTGILLSTHTIAQQESRKMFQKKYMHMEAENSLRAAR